jgi:hypothetical protein
LAGAITFILVIAMLFILFRAIRGIEDRWVQDLVFVIMAMRGSLLYPVWRKLIDPDNPLYAFRNLGWVAIASIPSAFVGALLSSKKSRVKAYGFWSAIVLLLIYLILTFVILSGYRETYGPFR